MHVMLDLETLDVTPTAVIAAIGAVKFDLEKRIVISEFYNVVDIEDCQHRGLTIGASTVRWWMQQGEEARRIFTVTPVTLSYALEAFAAFVEKEDRVWGNGSMFDNAILAHAYNRCRMPLPWSYKNDLCFRTLRKLFPVAYVREGTAHNALDDARQQVKELFRIYDNLG